MMRIIKFLWSIVCAVMLFLVTVVKVLWSMINELGIFLIRLSKLVWSPLSRMFAKVVKVITSPKLLLYLATSVVIFGLCFGIKALTSKAYSMSSDYRTKIKTSVKGIFETKPSPPSDPATTQERVEGSRPKEALLLEQECWTPCSAYIAWKFKIRTDGQPIKIKFQGVADPVEYPGEGDFKAPANMLSGETEFVSLDKERPHIRVQVYKKIIVRK